MVTRVSSVNILVRDQDGRTFLQMRDSRAVVQPLTWGFWGGRFDPGDRDPIACAARELEEELRVVAKRGDFEQLAERVGSDGQIAPLIFYRPPVRWPDVEIREGAGAGFFWRSDLEAIPVAKAVAWFLANAPEIFRAEAVA